MKLGQNATTDNEWRGFEMKYRAEMAKPANARTLALLAALLHQTDFSVGRYCENEKRCHRSVLGKRLG